MYDSPPHEAADELLKALGETLADIDRTEALADAALEEVERYWGAHLTPLRERLERLAALLRDLERKHKEVFWPGALPGVWSLALPHGALIYYRGDYVVKGRQVLRLAQLYGFEEALRRTVAVDWEALDDRQEWPDEALALIGTRRKPDEKFEYEIDESNQKGRKGT